MSEHPDLPVNGVGKLLRMLMSSSNGEVSAAVEALKRTLESAGTDIHALVDKLEHDRFTEEEVREIYRKGIEAGRQQAQQAPQGWRDQAEAILDSGRANEWETTFCEDILHSWRGLELTAKQNEVLQRIFQQRVRRWPT